MYTAKFNFTTHQLKDVSSALLHSARAGPCAATRHQNLISNPTATATTSSGCLGLILHTDATLRYAQATSAGSANQCTLFQGFTPRHVRWLTLHHALQLSQWRLLPPCGADCDTLPRVLLAHCNTTLYAITPSTLHTACTASCPRRNSTIEAVLLARTRNTDGGLAGRPPG